jgi:hypothetical protein
MAATGRRRTVLSTTYPYLSVAIQWTNGMRNARVVDSIPISGNL